MPGIMDFDADATFNTGFQMQQKALEAQLAREQADRAQKAQENLEKQRQLQAAQTDQRMQQQAARDSASNQFRDANLERQQQRDFSTEQMKNQQLNSNIFGDYIEDYVGGYQKRLDSLGQQYDQLAKSMLPRNPEMENKLYQENQYYTNVIAPALAKVGNITDLNAALSTVMGKKSPVNPEHVKAIIANTWTELQSQGIRDPETIQRALTQALQEDVARRNPAQSNEAIQKRMAEIDAERGRLNGVLQGSGIFNKLMSPQEYAAMRLGPLAMGQTTDPTQLSPPSANKRQHYASGMAMIGTFKDGKPVHINPQSWGGTVTSEDGRIQIVPSIHATVSDVLLIERLNQTGGKALAQPVIEDDVDVPLKEPKAPAQKNPNVNQNLAEQTSKEEQEVRKKVEMAIDANLNKAAQQFGAVITQFKQNPGSGLTYDTIMRALEKVAVQESSYPEAKYFNITPEMVYQKLIEKLPEFGIKALPTRENNKHSSQDVINLGNNFRDFYDQKLRRLQGAKSNQLASDIMNNPWVRGTWAVPNNFNDLMEYQRRLQGMQQ